MYCHLTYVAELGFDKLIALHGCNYYVKLLLNWQHFSCNMQPKQFQFQKISTSSLVPLINKHAGLKLYYTKWQLFLCLFKAPRSGTKKMLQWPSCCLGMSKSLIPHLELKHGIRNFVSFVFITTYLELLSREYAHFFEL